MQHEVWGDLLFLINFSMDFLCLYLTARLLHRRLRPLPALGAAVLGGVYSVAALFIETSRPISLLIDAAVCALMCAVAFARRGRRWRQLLSEIGVYLASAAALGGMMTALFNLLNRLRLPKNTGGDSISAWLFLLLALISGFTAWRGTGLLRGLRSRSFAEVEIVFCGRRLTLHGVTDSGNLLRDPITGRAVIITDTHSTLPLLPPGAYGSSPAKRSPAAACSWRCCPTASRCARRAARSRSRRSLPRPSCPRCRTAARRSSRAS